MVGENPKLIWDSMRIWPTDKTAGRSASRRCDKQVEDVVEKEQEEEQEEEEKDKDKDKQKQKQTRPSRLIRCDVWIVERMRYPTDQLTNGHSQL